MDSMFCHHAYYRMLINDDDDVYLKEDYNEDVIKFNQKCRPAKGISKRVNVHIIKDTDITEQPNNKYPKHSTHKKIKPD
jgi:hypothetical protein